MSTDLVPWLAAQLDLDQAHAEKDLWALDRATSGHWEAHYGYNLPYSLIMAGEVEIARLTATRGPLADGEEDVHAADALVVARLVNKARERAQAVLRTVAAHRAILDRHSPRKVLRFDGTAAFGAECDYCIEGEDAWTSPIHAPWPCPDVLSLLSIYDSRDGFDPSWRAD